MSKAEKFIQDYTNHCSNEIEWNVEGLTSHDYAPWLTPDQALNAVEIAREEMIEKFICWLNDNFRDDGGLCCIISDFDTTKEMYGNLKQAMR
jgi:hypothetical protein